MIKARFVGSSLPMTQRRAGLFAETPALSPLRYLVSKLATNKCGEERKCVAVMDVKLDTTNLHRGSHRIAKEPVGWSVCKMGWFIVRDT